jgi:hypothetical protein
MKKNKKIIIVGIIIIVLIVSIPFIKNKIEIRNAEKFYLDNNEDFNHIAKTAEKFKHVSHITKNWDLQNNNESFNILFLKYTYNDKNITEATHLKKPILNINSDSLNKLLLNIEGIENGEMLLGFNKFVSRISIDPYNINIKTNDITWEYSYKQSINIYETGRIKLDNNWELEPLYKHHKFEY